MNSPNNYNDVDFGEHVRDKVYFTVKDPEKIKIINDIYSENVKNYKYNSEVEIKDEELKSYKELKEILFRHIEGFYNTRRIQKKLGYLSPREYLKKIS